jgi:signal transduction histidine kinase
MTKNKSTTIFNFKVRRIVQYTLIICILLIQVTIAGFFYNEFINRKNNSFIEKQLQEIHALENLTDDSRKEYSVAQENLFKYFSSNDEKFLESYFASISKLGKTLDSINHFKEKNTRLKNILETKKKDAFSINKLQSLIDSTYQYSTTTNFKAKEEFPKLKKYDYNFKIEKYDVQTEKFSDTIVKKGFFKRLGDAIGGKVDVKNDSTVVTLKQRKLPDFTKLQSEVDSVVNLVDNHYVREVKRVHVNLNDKRNKNDNENRNFFNVFSNLLVRSNDLMNVYEFSIRESKSDLEKEYAKQNSENNKIKNYLVLGLMILMFIVSILIMYFTRIAFIYESKLKKANIKINENLKFKNRILGMLSHELRSPLKIIGIFINRIGKKTTDENVIEYLKSISFTNNTLLMQANQILEYTKNQQVENKLLPVIFNLKKEIQSILTAIEPYIETRNNQFITEENINPNLVIYSDNTKINQIFMNILGNANKFTENGQISVKITTNNSHGDFVVLNTIIRDTGSGISQADLEKIFEPYYQGIVAEEVENLGAGLGLSLCKEIIELYDGTISVESEVNKGTTVNFSIKLKINGSGK